MASKILRRPLAGACRSIMLPTISMTRSGMSGGSCPQRKHLPPDKSAGSRVTIRLSALGFSILLILAWFGCSEDPNSTGFSLLPANDSLTVYAKQLSGTADTTFRTRISASSQSVLVGQSQGLIANALISFDGVAGIPSASILDSARLNLRLNYRFKDSTGSFGVEVRRMVMAFKV